MYLASRGQVSYTWSIECVVSRTIFETSPFHPETLSFVNYIILNTGSWTNEANLSLGSTWKPRWYNEPPFHEQSTNHVSLKKVGLDVLQSHPLCGHVSANTSCTGVTGRGDCYLMQKVQSSGWPYPMGVESNQGWRYRLQHSTLELQG